MTTYRVHYSVRLQSSYDIDAPDQISASDAAREWLRRTYGSDLRSVEILRAVEKGEPE